MKRWVMQICLTVFLYSAALWAYAGECSRLVVTGHPNYPPLLWSTGSTLDGAPVRLAQKLAAEVGAQVQVINPGDWEKAVTAVRTGDADMIVGIYFNDERTSFLEFVRPAWIQDTVSVIVAQDRSFAFSGIADLVERRGAAGKAESFGNDLDKYIAEKLNVTRTDGLSAAFDMLLAGQTDYVIDGTYPALKVAIERGIKDKVAVLEPPLVTEGGYMAFSKKSACQHLAAAFGKRIEEMQKSGDIDALIRAATQDWEATRK
jgi:polar amino acid transport system substrate-binding protein